MCVKLTQTLSNLHTFQLFVVVFPVSDCAFSCNCSLASLGRSCPAALSVSLPRIAFPLASFCVFGSGFHLLLPNCTATSTQIHVPATMQASLEAFFHPLRLVLVIGAGDASPGRRQTSSLPFPGGTSETQLPCECSKAGEAPRRRASKRSSKEQDDRRFIISNPSDETQGGMERRIYPDPS
eukprot:scaffold1454_cov342-Pavlova_lutheri.AAC.6